MRKSQHCGYFPAYILNVFFIEVRITTKYCFLGNSTSVVRFANENLGRASAVAVRPAGCEQQSFSTTSSKNSDLMLDFNLVSDLSQVSDL